MNKQRWERRIAPVLRTTIQRLLQAGELEVVSGPDGRREFRRIGRKLGARAARSA